MEATTEALRVSDWPSLGAAMWERATALGYANRDELADAAGVSRRTLVPLLNGNWVHPPTPKTLKALEIALACRPGSLVQAFQTADPSVIASQPLNGSDDPRAWLLSQLHARGATTDPDWITAMARRVEGTVPDAARLLLVLADMASTGHSSDKALTELPVPEGDTRAQSRAAAARSRQRRAAALVKNQQLPLVASA